MATFLNQHARTHLYESEELKKIAADYMGISLAGVNSAIIRNSSSLMNWNVVETIAASMKAKPESLIEEK